MSVERTPSPVSTVIDNPSAERSPSARTDAIAAWQDGHPHRPELTKREIHEDPEDQDRDRDEARGVVLDVRHHHAVEERNPRDVEVDVGGTLLFEDPLDLGEVSDAIARLGVPVRHAPDQRGGSTVARDQVSAYDRVVDETVRQGAGFLALERVAPGRRWGEKLSHVESTVGADDVACVGESGE